MLKTITATAALALFGTLAPLPGSEANAARETYRQCVGNVYATCLPSGPLGPELPPPGSPEEEAYYQCLDDGFAYCATLPDAP